MQGELLSLGHQVAVSAIAKSCNATASTPLRVGPSTTWRRFLRRQAAGIVACDFFSVDTVKLKRLYVLLFMVLRARLARSVDRTDDEFEVRVAAAALMGAIKVALLGWIESQGTTNLGGVDRARARAN